MGIVGIFNLNDDARKRFDATMLKDIFFVNYFVLFCHRSVHSMHISSCTWIVLGLSSATKLLIYVFFRIVRCSLDDLCAPQNVTCEQNGQAESTYKTSEETTVCPTCYRLVFD